MIAKAKTPGQVKYADKLRDPRWQKVRLKVMERDDWRCLRCRAKTKTLNVHHLQYHGDPWEAPEKELETLCEECHAWRTEYDQRMRVMPTAEIETIMLFVDLKGFEAAALTYIRSQIAEGREAVRDKDIATQEGFMDYPASAAAQEKIDLCAGRIVRVALTAMGLK